MYSNHALICCATHCYICCIEHNSKEGQQTAHHLLFAYIDVVAMATVHDNVSTDQECCVGPLTGI